LAWRWAEVVFAVAGGFPAGDDDRVVGVGVQAGEAEVGEPGGAQPLCDVVVPGGADLAGGTAVFQPRELGADVLALPAGHVDADPRSGHLQVTGPAVSAAAAATASSNDR
jgi:hypothetical protein